MSKTNRKILKSIRGKTHVIFRSRTIKMKEMQIKTINTQRNNLTLIRMTIIKKSTNNKYWRECVEWGTLLHCWQECNLIQPLWRIVWRLLKKLKVELPYDPAIPLLGIYSEKNLVLNDTCTPKFIAVLSEIAKTWKQHNVHQQRNG